MVQEAIDHMIEVARSKDGSGSMSVMIVATTTSFLLCIMDQSVCDSFGTLFSVDDLWDCLFKREMG